MSKKDWKINKNPEASISYSTHNIHMCKTHDMQPLNYATNLNTWFEIKIIYLCLKEWDPAYNNIRILVE